ncbi:hypothetical protein HYS48_04935 [Candidatus Woesearchaeota archaeon]|nr:hypothetical protein [Candidatus Woesearchaeota archaeon]
MVALKSLEESLRETGNLENFSRALSHPIQKVRETTALLFAIAYALEQKKLNRDYVVYGGYSVLLQLARTVGIEAIALWRGSYDIDMVGSEKVVESIKEQYRVISDRVSPNVRGKRTLRVQIDETEPIKIDIRQKEEFLDEPSEVYYQDIETVELFGIPVNVLTLERQLKDKLSITRRNLQRDREDIYTLLGLLYLRGSEPVTLAHALDLNQRRKLYDMLKGVKYIKEEVLVEPDIPYLSNLKKALKKRGV